jgi:outer membrane protein TolC
VYAGARLTVPLFDSTQKRIAIRRQRLKLEKSENDLLDLRQDICYELTNTATQLLNARKAVDVQRENLQIANEVVEQTKVRLGQALATTQDVLDAKATLRDTQLNFLQALHDLMITRLE